MKTIRVDGVDALADENDTWVTSPKNLKGGVFRSVPSSEMETNRTSVFTDTTSAASGARDNARASPESSITEKQATTTTKGRNWSITLNNPTEEELQRWKTVTEFHWVKEAQGQLERGESGTLHIQGMLRTDPVAWTRVKRLFPRAHVEAARNAFALAKYVGKDDTRVASLGTQKAPPRKVVTPNGLMTALASVVYERTHHKGLPLLWTEDERRGWRKDFWDTPDEWETLEPPQQRRIVYELNREWLKRKADDLITEAVDNLIYDGVLGAEYATMHLACRASLKRHLIPICIRHETYEWSQATHGRAEGDPEAQETSSTSTLTIEDNGT